MSDRFLAMLKRHEGVKLKPYLDTVGKWTVGIGRNVTDKGISDDELDHFGITYVPNFQVLIKILSGGITEEQADYLCQNDVAEATRDASTFAWFPKLDEVRRDVIVDMIFNMGLERFKTFKHMIEFIEVGQYFAAADQMLKSSWLDQVKERAIELSMMMEAGKYTDEI